VHRSETTQASRLVLSSGDLILRSIALHADRMTIGRRPYNQIALDDLTVSGEHAQILRVGDQWRIRDLQSRNGTLVNGRLIAEEPLRDGDLIDIGVYRIKYFESPVARAPVEPDGCGPALVEVLNGAQAGSRITLERAITSVGNTGSQVAVIARRRNGYHITHLEGLAFPLVNGESIGLLAHPLCDNDLIELGGTTMRFRTSG
jgi:hypothetical protein